MINILLKRGEFKMKREGIRMKKKEKMSNVIAVSIIMILCSMFIVFVNVEKIQASPITEESYQSSEFFSITNNEGTWDNGIWAAQTYDPDTGVYQNMTKTLANKANRDEAGTGPGPVYMDTASGDSANVNGYWYTPASKKLRYLLVIKNQQ